MGGWVTKTIFLNPAIRVAVNKKKVRKWYRESGWARNARVTWKEIGRNVKKERKGMAAYNRLESADLSPRFRSYGCRIAGAPRRLGRKADRSRRGGGQRGGRRQGSRWGSPPWRCSQRGQPQPPSHRSTQARRQRRPPSGCRRQATSRAGWGVSQRGRKGHSALLRGGCRRRKEGRRKDAPAKTPDRPPRTHPRQAGRRERASSRSEGKGRCYCDLPCPGGFGEHKPYPQWRQGWEGKTRPWFLNNRKRPPHSRCRRCLCECTLEQKG